MNLHVTPREDQILMLLASGLSQKEISEVLGCSTGTVDTHLKNIKEKTGLQKNTELGCAYFVKHHNVPVFAISEKTRQRIAQALLVLSLTGIFCHADFLRVLRPASRTVNSTAKQGARSRRNRREEYNFLAA